MEGDQVESSDLRGSAVRGERDDHRPLRPRRHGGRRFAALTGCESVVGAESAAITGEPHALDGPADPLDQQAITWCAALEWRQGEDHTIDRPEAYSFGEAIGPISGRDLNWAGQPQNPRLAGPLTARCSQNPSRTCGRSAGFGMAAITSMSVRCDADQLAAG